MWRFSNKQVGVRQLRSSVLNFGPQHPASHGVLRLVLQLRGELVLKVDSHIGFLHRGSEKLMESRNYTQSALYLDRLDYTSVLTQTHAYCLCVEELREFHLQRDTYIVRVIFDELARMLNHLLAVSTHSLDVGSMAPLFWVFEDRERIMEIFEYVSGARMHVAFYIPCKNLVSILTTELYYKLVFFIRNCHKSFTEMFVALFNNRVWKLRLVGIGVLSAQEAILMGATGPILRSTGVLHDLRVGREQQYAYYWFIGLRSYVGNLGDSFDRFLIRSRELFESVCIISQAIGLLNFTAATCGVVAQMAAKALAQLKGLQFKTKIESLIKHFKQIQDSLVIERAFHYSAVEAGKGEFGVSLVSNNTKYPYRVQLRSPAYNHLQLLARLGQGHYLADIVVLIGTLDLVFGEVDR